MYGIASMRRAIAPVFCSQMLTRGAMRAARSICAVDTRAIARNLHRLGIEAGPRRCKRAGGHRRQAGQSRSASKTGGCVRAADRFRRRAVTRLLST